MFRIISSSFLGNPTLVGTRAAYVDCERIHKGEEEEAENTGELRLVAGHRVDLGESLDGQKTDQIPPATPLTAELIQGGLRGPPMLSAAQCPPEALQSVAPSFIVNCVSLAGCLLFPPLHLLSVELFYRQDFI